MPSQASNLVAPSFLGTGPRNSSSAFRLHCLSFTAGFFSLLVQQFGYVSCHYVRYSSSRSHRCLLPDLRTSFALSFARKQNTSPTALVIVGTREFLNWHQLILLTLDKVRTLLLSYMFHLLICCYLFLAHCATFATSVSRWFTSRIFKHRQYRILGHNHLTTFSTNFFLLSIQCTPAIRMYSWRSPSSNNSLLL